jgi:arylsulfatase A-like enzyme
MDPRPNILWICSDQQRWDTLGCYRNEYVHTPNIDALAQGGVLFERCYAQNPVCSPSRSSFLTGRYPHVTGCRQNGQRIRETERVLSKILHESGYTCGLAGKYHLSPCSPSVSPQSEERIDDGYDVFDWSHGHAPKHPANAYQRWLAEQNVPYKTEDSGLSRWIETGMPEEYHQTTWCVNRAISFIEHAGKFNMPWLFSLNIFDPHPPFDPPAALLQHFADRLDTLPLPIRDSEPSGKSAWLRERFACSRGQNLKNIKQLCADEMSDRDHRAVKAAYWAMCELIDRQVGRLIAVLKAGGQYENTIIVYHSDHGEMLGDHDMYYKDVCLFEGVVHVPLILHYPKLLKPRRISENTELMHIAPTLLEAAGGQATPGMQTTSLWQALCKGEDLDGEDVFAEFYNSLADETTNSHENYSSMLISGDWKLIIYHGQMEGELYDLAHDPHEIHNRFHDPDCAGHRAEMLLRLCNKMAWTSDPLPERTALF